MKHLLLTSLLVGAFGFFGAIARFLVATSIQVSGFPVSTLVINLTGSLFLGWFMTAAGSWMGVPPPLRIGIAVGFVGAYTTFSTYMFESNAMLMDGSFWRATLYILGSVFLGLICVRAGVMLGHLR